MRIRALAMFIVCFFTITAGGFVPLFDKEDLKKNPELEQLLKRHESIQRILKQSPRIERLFNRVEAYIKDEESQAHREFHNAKFFDEEDLIANPELEELVVRNMLVMRLFQKVKTNPLIAALVSE